MSQKPKHRFPDLVRLHSQYDTLNIVYGTYEEPTYYYAGTKSVPDTDAFTNTLRWYREDRYKSILCFTHYKSSLPSLYVDGNLLTSSIISWRMWGQEQKKEPEETQESDDLLADLQNIVMEQTTKNVPLGAPQKIQLRAHDVTWSDQILEFFLTLESELGLSWKGSVHQKNSNAANDPILIVACSQWLLPDPNLNDFLGTAPHQNYFQPRWDGILERLEETKSRIVIITSHLLFAKVLCEPKKYIQSGGKEERQYESLMNLCTQKDTHRRSQKLDQLHSLQWWIQFGDKDTPYFMLPSLDTEFPYGENYKNDGSDSLLKRNLGQVLSTHTPKDAEDPMDAFDNYIGMEELKRAMKRLQKNLNNPNRDRRHLHFLLEGNPGTGKTVVAKTIAHIMYKYGVIRENKFTSITHKDLEGQYVGHTGARTNTVIQKAYGGVLFIDEAHSLKAKNSFHTEAVSTMLPYMENEEHIGNILFIFAGYPKSSTDDNDVRELFRIDAGLNSRIVKQNQFLLPDYNPDEMVDIFFLFSKLKDIEVEDSEAFRSTLKEQIHHAKSRENAREFGNARRMRTHIEYLKETIWADHNRNNITRQDLHTYPL